MIYYIINADQQKNRWNNTLSLLKKYSSPEQNLNIQRVSAIMGKDLPLDIIQSLQPNNKYPAFYPRSSTLGEIGCYLSHKACWELFLETKEEWAIIYEDDILTTTNAKQFILDTSWIPNNVDIVQLCSWRPNSDKFYIRPKTIKLQENFELIQPVTPPSFGSQAYLINRKGAQVAIQESEKIRAPVDHMLFDQNSPIAKRVNIWTLSPFVIYQDEEQNGSTLSTGRASLKRKIFWKCRIFRRFRKIKMSLQKIFTLVPYTRSIDK